jgi:microcystin degradation protein MlrC
VSPSIPDVDGHWLTELRRRVGADVPIVCTLDPHANLSPAMVSACDAIAAYRTNPHLDQHARGLEAAEWMARSLRGEIQLTTAAVHLPLIIDIERQCTKEEPCRKFCAKAEAMVAESPNLLGWSIVLGFPYADVAEMGTSVVFVADGDAALAQSAATRLARTIWERRGELVGRHISIEEALDQAARIDGTVCLLDMGDNVGGGSPGDGTLLAQALHARGRGSSFVCLYDPESVQAATAAGIGQRVTLRVGGKTDSLHGAPLEAEFTVLGLFDGKFEETQPRHGGIKEFDQGPTAVVRSDRGLTAMLTSRRVPPFSLRQLTAFGIKPEQYDVLVAKGVNAPIAAYAPVARHMIRVDTPGVTTADVTRLAFQNRRRPMFPFEGETEWEG